MSLKTKATFAPIVNMNSEKIDNILQGKSSRMRVEYFLNHHKEVYYEICKWCENYDMKLPFKEMLWHYTNNHIERIKCFLNCHLF